MACGISPHGKKTQNAGRLVGNEGPHLLLIDESPPFPSGGAPHDRLTAEFFATPRARQEAFARDSGGALIVFSRGPVTNPVAAENTREAAWRQVSTGRGWA